MKPITRNEIEALRAFAAANGRSWKAELNQLWQTGAYNNAVMGNADAGTLQTIRNTRGPTWLQNYRLAPPGCVHIELTSPQYRTLRPLILEMNLIPAHKLRLRITDAQELYRRAEHALPAATTAQYVTREAILNKLVTPE